MKRWIGVVLWVVLAGCRTPEPPVVEAAAEPSPPARTVEELVASLGRLEEVSDGTFEVNLELLMLCVGPAPNQIAKAEKKHGPHTMTSIRVSMTEPAAKAFREKSSYPVGSAIVKVKNTGATGGMIKREPGYDDLGGDWEYFYAEAKGRLERGKLETCRTCHMTTRSTDHVFGSWKPTQRTQEP